MANYIAWIISGVSVVFAVYFGLSNVKRGDRAELRTDASEMTTVIVKLENIGNGIAEIKSEMAGVKNEIKDFGERLVRVEESSKQAHKRLDEFKKGAN